VTDEEETQEYGRLRPQKEDVLDIELDDGMNEFFL
jgi:hypothetical protein